MTRDEQPNKITILHEYGSDFTVVTSTGYPGRLETAEHLTFDEMLGYIARLNCPAYSDGNPIRSWGRPLFLEPPAKAEPPHPDAAGDYQPIPLKKAEPSDKQEPF